jgi:hypothetical protein
MMTAKTRKIIAIVVGAVPSIMMLMSATMKLSGNPEMVKGLSAGGLGSYITLFGMIEVVSVLLFFIPKTNMIGFLLLCSYLGGAFATELSHGMMPMSAILIALYWISMFIKDKSLFLGMRNNNAN